MRNKTLTGLVLLMLIGALVTVGWGEDGATARVAVTDKLGRQVEIPLPVRRVVLLSLYELIPVLDLWDRVVGVNRWALDNKLLKRFSRMETIPAVGTGIEVNAEAILACHPDLVITWSYRPEVVEFLARKGLRVLAVYPEHLDELYGVIELCGQLFDREKRAREVRQLMEDLFTIIRSRVSQIPPEQRRRVLWLWQKPTRVTGRYGLQQDLLAMVGAVNPAQHVDMAHAEVSLEQILAWNPEVVFIWGHAGYGPETLTEGRQWQSVAAVKEGRIYKAPLADSWSPSTAVMALWMVRKIYPEAFREQDLAAEARKFHLDCFGIPLAEGIFE